MVIGGAALSRSRISETHGANWGWLLALGIFMCLLGMLGIGMSYRLTLVAVFWCGVLAIVGGIAQILDGFHHKAWRGTVWQSLIGLIYVIAGVAMVTMPVSAAFWLTIFLAISLVVTGIVRIGMAFQMGQQGAIRLAVLFSGIVSIALGVMIYGFVTPPGAEALATQEGQLAWVRSWGWIIGLLVAIELIMEGVALIALALAARSNQDVIVPTAAAHQG
jgi:uncharacterized membrane protein HdeD (DUF308 family)